MHGQLVGRQPVFLNAKKKKKFYENHWGGPIFKLLNKHGVLNVLNMPEDASLACWALFLRVNCVSQKYKKVKLGPLRLRLNFCGVNVGSKTISFTNIIRDI